MKVLKAFTKLGTEVRAGEGVTDFRGEVQEFCRATRANGEGRDGKVAVYVSRDADNDSTRELYAGVFGLEVREVEVAEVVGHVEVKAADIAATKRRAERAAERKRAAAPFNTIKGLEGVRVKKAKKGGAR